MLTYRETGAEARRRGESYWTNPHLEGAWEETHVAQGEWSEGWLDADRELEPEIEHNLLRMRPDRVLRTA